MKFTKNNYLRKTKLMNELIKITKKMDKEPFLQESYIYFWKFVGILALGLRVV